MRIAQFTESYRPVINGAAVAVDLIADALRARHTVEVFAPRFPGHKDALPTHRFPSYSLPGHRDYPLAFPWSPCLYALFKTAGYDVVHTHSPFALGQTGLRWARRHGIRVVTTYHTLYVEYAHYARGIPAAVSRAFLQRLSRDYCNACDAIAVPTEPVREVLLEYGVRTPVHVIPTGLKLGPPHPRDPEFRAGLGIPADASVVLFAGRLAEEKNLPLLIAAFDGVAQAAPDAWLLICGSGPAESDLRRRAGRSGAAERIVFAGSVQPERMPVVYAAADLFAFTSVTDTQALVITEAKAAGLPAVSVDAYGPGVVVKDGVDGLLVPNDADAFGAALRRLLTEPVLRARMAAAALADAQTFSIETTAARYEEIYE